MELLAPAGSIQAMKTAINSGANAVYLGLDCFNARIKASNFSKENIKEYTEYCHLFGVKVYVTFNTCIKDDEINIFEGYVEACAEANVDAFIVTDLGMLDIFKKYNIPLHASTQMGIHNLEGAQFVEKLGFSRVILSRETLLCDIASIKINTKLEIEYFAHGALCVSFSGGCLMSSMMSGDSGNRGRCNQPCRMQYTSIFSNVPQYLLSTKDQCMLTKISTLASAGVDSLKIEGRLRQEHYVGEAVTQYRKAIDDRVPYKNSMKMLKRAFNRGDFTEGYNFNSTSEIMYPKIQGNIGDCIGEVIDYRKGELYIKANEALKVGDGLKLILNGKELGGFAVRSVSDKGSAQVVPSEKSYPIGAEVHITLDVNQVEKYSTVSPKIGIKIRCIAKVGETLRIEFSKGNLIAKVFGNIVDIAQNKNVSAEQLQKNLTKLGETVFECEQCNVECDDNIFLPMSEVNNLRRDAVEILKDSILNEYNLHKTKVDFAKSEFCSTASGAEHSIDKRPFVIVNSASQLSSYVIENCNLVVEVQEFTTDNIESILNYTTIHNTLTKYKPIVYIKLPKIARGKDMNEIIAVLDKIANQITGLICDNIYAIQLAKNYGILAIGGIGLNIFNSKASKILQLDSYIASAELNLTEMKSMTNAIVYSFGYLPIMTFTHCPIQLNTKCTCDKCGYKGNFYYKDSIASYLITRNKIRNCYFNMHNPQIIDIRGKISKISNQKILNMLEFKKDEIDEIVEDYLKENGQQFSNSTCGHLFRGVK